MLDADDRARTAYVMHFNGVDPADPRLHNLMTGVMGSPVPAAHGRRAREENNPER
ncbi:hypothetical protein [Actinomadura sp. GTD37]|uniref:hypothetical protein n=1 Tax=Actinomadura sp. GTD37 TaxID=1778030 RepID=UPI0035C0D631